VADVLKSLSGKGMRRYKDMGDNTIAEVFSAQIGRDRGTTTVTVPSGEALSDTIDFRDMAGAILHMPAAWTTADVAFYVSPSGAAGTFQPLYDGSSLVEIASPAAGKSYVMPAELFAALYVQIWSQTSGVSENQTADRQIQLSLKA